MEENDRKPWFIRLVEWLVTFPDERRSESGTGDGDDGRDYTDVRRNYQVWNSKSQVFVMGGRFRTLKRSLRGWITFSCCIIPFVLFCIFEASWWWHKISPVVVITFVYSWILCTASFIKASTRDPGFVPHNVHLTEDPYNIPEEYRNVISLPCSTSKKGVQVRYCLTCRSWRMPRTFHCSKCDQCISIHDHHCVWITNCVGERNYAYFFAFLVFAVFSSTYLIVLEYVRLFYNDDVDTTLSNTPVTLLILIMAHITILYPLLLLILHVSLIAKGQTTREYLRTWKIHRYDNPFSMGNILKNSVYALCKPRGYSAVSSRARYEPGDVRFRRFES